MDKVRGAPLILLIAGGGVAVLGIALAVGGLNAIVGMVIGMVSFQKN